MDSVLIDGRDGDRVLRLEGLDRSACLGRGEDVDVADTTRHVLCWQRRMTSSRRSVSPLCYFHDPIERPREFGVSKRDNRRYLGKAGAFQNEGVHIYASSVSNCRG